MHVPNLKNNIGLSRFYMIRLFPWTIISCFALFFNIKVYKSDPRASASPGVNGGTRRRTRTPNPSDAVDVTNTFHASLPSRSTWKATINPPNPRRSPARTVPRCSRAWRRRPSTPAVRWLRPKGSSAPFVLMYWRARWSGARTCGSTPRTPSTFCCQRRISCLCTGTPRH